MELLDFPNELLLEILGYINAATFKNVTLTCKRLKELAEKSGALNRVRLSLSFPDSNCEDRVPLKIIDFFNIYNTSERTYKNISIKYLKLPIPSHPLVKDNLKFLLLKHKFEDVVFDMFNMFMDEFETIAVNLVNVKKISIYRSYLHKVGSMRINCDFPKLEKLFLFHSGSYMEVFKNCTSLKYFGLEYVTIFDKPLLEQIIFQQDNLKTIEFNNVAKCTLFRTPLTTNRRCMVKKIIFNEIFYEEVDGYLQSLNKRERNQARDENGNHFLDKFFSQISNSCPNLEEFVCKTSRATITNHQIQLLCSEHKKMKRLELGYACEKLTDETQAIVRKMPNSYKFRFVEASRY
jgi:hypothetical protein